MIEWIGGEPPHKEDIQYLVWTDRGPQIVEWFQDTPSKGWWCQCLDGDFYGTDLKGTIKAYSTLNDPNS